MESCTIVAGCYERFLFGFRPLAATDDSAPSSSSELDRCFTYAAHQGSVKCLKSIGNFIASGGADDLIHIYDLNSGADLGFLMHPGHGSITALDAFTPADSSVPTHVFSGGDDGVVNVWQAGGSWDHLESMKGHKSAVSAVAVHPSGRVAMSVGLDAGLRLWDLAKGKTTYASLLQERGQGLAWAKGGEAYAVLLDSGKVLVRSVVGEGVTLATFETPRKQLCVVGDGEEVLLTGSEDGFLRLWDVSNSSCPLEVKGHSTRVRGVARVEGAGATPRGLPARLASASSDGVIKLWDVRMMGGSGGSSSKPLSEASTSARLTCLAVAPGPAVLHEMAIAQAKADKFTESAKKKRVLQRVHNKATKAANTKSGDQQQEAFEVVPVAKTAGKTKAAKGAGAKQQGGPARGADGGVVKKQGKAPQKAAKASEAAAQNSKLVKKRRRPAA